MTQEQILLATLAAITLTAITYWQTGLDRVKDCYKMWLTRDYWQHAYNRVEAVSWLAKAVIIIPGLIFGVNIWQLYWLTLITSLTLIWASNKKLMPTLVAFNTMWAWLSCMVLARHLI
jgi:hypothetical protein